MITLQDLSDKYGYSKQTIRDILCRAEFEKYRNVKGWFDKWNDELEARLIKVIELKQKRGHYGKTTATR